MYGVEQSGLYPLEGECHHIFPCSSLGQIGNVGKITFACVHSVDTFIQSY